MANSKKTEDELDAVSAAYESISAKLDDLRKKQESLQAEADDKPAAKSKSKAEEVEPDEDDGEIEEFDDQAEDEKPVKAALKPAKDEADEPLEPLPGTDDEPEDSKPVSPRVVKPPMPEDDPLDNEEPEDSNPDQPLTSEADQNDENEEPAPKTLSARGADEMEKWEKQQSGSEDDEEPVSKPTFTPVSQKDFQSALRRPTTPPEEQEESEDEALMPPTPLTSHTSPASPTSEANQNSDEPADLDDLANEPEENATATGFNRSGRMTEPEEAGEWGIRRLKPQSNQDYDQSESYDQEPPIRNNKFRRPPVDDDGYFERRNQPLPRKQGSIWHLLILILIGVGVIGATVYFLKYQFNATPKPSPSPEMSSPSPSIEPTPTPAAMVDDRSQYTVRVLNGTSQTGLAGTILQKLKDAGFKTDRAGNATNSAFEQTIIRVKDSSNSAALVNTITKDLGSDYSPTSDTSLKGSDKADAEIILGAK